MKAGAAALAATIGVAGAQAAVDSSDALLNALIKKGILTQDEADKVKAEAAASQTNMPPSEISKWKISNAIKNVELFGDIRFRFEDRYASAAGDNTVRLQRERYALRLGLRGDLVDNFYYGLRLETAANPRSPWVTFGTSSSGVPFQGPFGKGTAGINLGQVYLGWKPADWAEFTIGKMPMPLYTTPMVWDTDINPEGLAEHFKYTVGEADFFANFGQFIYQDTNPTQTGFGFFPSLFPQGTNSSAPLLLAWQVGMNYHVDKDITFKVAPVLYNYTDKGVNTSSGATILPGFSGIFVGQGAANGAVYSGVHTSGYSGYPNGNINGISYDGFAANQTGINDLLILEIPAEINFKLGKYKARVFGDFSENLDGAARARDAFNESKLIPNITPIPFAATDQVKAWQVGFAIGNGDALGLTYGALSKKHTWEARAYWQHVEQYALDPNLLDSDFFEGRGNLQGFYSAVAYSITDNIIGTLRYGYADQIDGSLGTGGSNQDIPQVNAIHRYQLIQADLTCRF